MSQYADKSNEPERRSVSQQQEQQKSRAAANESVQKRSNSESTFELIDNRPKAVAQRKLIKMANNSPRSKRLAAMQDMANSSPRANKLAQLFGKKESEVEPVQKKGPLDEDELQFKSKEAVQKKGPLDEEELQFKAKEPVENNTGLPDNLKAGVENLSGMAMDDVRVHYNSSKPAQLNAYAYTQGKAIYVGPGQEKHLPHEAWHVVQQKQGRVKPTVQMKGGVPVNDDAGLENEADVMGGKALQCVDNQPETIAQKKIQEVVNSPQVKQLRDIQDIATNRHYNISDFIQRMYVPPYRRGGAAPAPVLTARDQIINAVQAVFNPAAVLPAAAGAGILAFHPPTQQETWEYTRTVQYTVPVPGQPNAVVRGHIHYTNTTTNVGPGSMWISCVDNYQFRTPDAVVNQYQAIPNLQDRTKAVQQFNLRQKSNYTVL